MKMKYLLEVSEISDKSVEVYNGVKKYSATGDVDYNKIANFEEVDYETKPSRANRMVVEGEILFAKMKGTTKVLKITDEIANKYIFSTGFTTLKNKEGLDKDYLYYVLISEYFQTEKDKYCSGATQKAINNTNLKKIKIPVPPIESQEKIVEVLDQAQALIDKRKEQIKSLDQLIESIFYTMFGDPVRNEKGWEVKKLGELGIFKNGLNYSKEDNGYNIKCLGVGDFLRLNKIEDMSKIQEIDVLEKPNSDYLLKDEDILFVRSNGNKQLVGRNIIIYPGDSEATFSGFCIRFRKKINNLNLIFLNYQIKKNTMQNRLQSKIRGANIQNLNQKILSDLDVIYPPISLQNEFAQKVEAIEKQKKLLEESLDLLEENYKSIMDRAFKGQLFN